MKIFFLCVCVIGSCICRPPGLAAQESLLTKTLKGNSTIIYSLAFSPDGKYLAAGGAGNTLKIWRLEDGACVKTLTGHNSFTNSVSFSPDGKKLLSASEDTTIKIWNVATGACLNTLKGHTDFVLSAAFFPDGKRLASVSADGTLKLWRTDAKAPYKTLKGHAGYIYSVSVAPDGKQIASGGVDRTVKIWDAESGVRRMTLEGHSDAVNSVAFSPKGTYLASGGDDGSVKIWRLKDGVCVKTFTADRRPVHSVAYSPDGTYVFSGSGDGTANAWSAIGDVQQTEYKGHGGLVKSVAVSPDGSYLASGSFDKTIKLWLTPWEAERRNREIRTSEQIETEKDVYYTTHYETGLLAMSTPTIANLELSVSHFTKALSYRKNADCEAKLGEATELLGIKKVEEAKDLARKQREELNARRQRELLLKQRAAMGLKALAGLIVFLAIARVVYKTKKKIGFRRAFPDEIRTATAAGDYEKVFKQYTEYKALGGNIMNLPQEDLLRLYHGIGALDKLPRENIPYNFLLGYAAKFANSGNFKTALVMLRSGQLLDEFRKPEDYDAFVDIFEKANRPENLLMRKFKSATYSGLAEAFFKVKDYTSCKKICAFKKQFHASKLSRRDHELVSLSQEAALPAAPETTA